MSYASFGRAFGDTGVLPAVQQLFAAGTVKVGNLNFLSPAAKPLMGPALMPTTFVQDATNSSSTTVMGNILFAPTAGEGTLVTINRFLDKGFVVMAQLPASILPGALPLLMFSTVAPLIAAQAQDGGDFVIIDGPAALLAAADALAAAPLPTCPPGQVGVPPACFNPPPAPPPSQCPQGTTGTWPNCVPIVTPGPPQPGTPPPGPPAPLPVGPIVVPAQPDKPFLAAMGGRGLLLGLGIAVALVLMVKGSSKPKYAANRRRRSR